MPPKDMRAETGIAPAPVPDDFKRIKGIGPAIERRLHAAGILTYADLAKLTPDQVSEQTGGLSAKIVARQRWIRQARKLASESAGRPLHRARFRIELILDDNDIVQYTKVKYIRLPEDEAASNSWDDGWGGWNEESLINFFVQRAALKGPSRQQPLQIAEMATHTKKSGVRTRESKVMLEMPIDQLLHETQLPAEASTSVPSAVTPVETSASATQVVTREPVQDQVPIQPPAEAAAQASPADTIVETGAPATQPVERALEPTVEREPAQDQVPIQPPAEAAAQAPSADTTVETGAPVTQPVERALEPTVEREPAQEQVPTQPPAEAAAQAPSADTIVETGAPATQPVERAPEPTVEREPAQDQVQIQPPAEAAAQAPSADTTVETAASASQAVERAPEPVVEHEPIQPLAEALAPVSSVATPVPPSPVLQLGASDMQVVDSPIQDLRAQFSFYLAGAKANEIVTAQLSYFVQILACELSTGHITVLATDTHMLQPGSMIYTSTADFAMPVVGRYQTFGVIFLSIPDDNSIPDRARIDIAWGPILNITP